MTSPLDQKIKITGPVVVTANRTVDGAVIYRGANGDWTTMLSEAVIATTAVDARALLAAAAAEGIGTIGAYVAPVKLAAGGQVRPGNLRERIRLNGPTIAVPAAAAHLPQDYKEMVRA